MPVIVRWFLRLSVMNPIAVRLVQNGSRRSKHLYIRSGYLAVLILTMLWLLLAGTDQGQVKYQALAAAGAGAFTWIAYLQITLICILAPVFMGGAIAQEASPRTWEVLLTTPMTAGEIVLGNLFGRLFFVLALLLASLPLFALTQYFGGVPGRAILTSYLVAGCAALVVGAVAIALSVSRLVGKRAFFIFYVTVVAYLGVTLAIDLFLRGRGQGALNGQGVTYMTALNPFLSLHALLNPSTYPRAPEGSLRGLSALMLERPVTTWCVGSTVVSIVSMAASTFTVRLGGLGSLTQDSGGVPWYRRVMRLPPKGAEHRAPKAVWNNPISWREAASRNSTPSKIAARYTFLGLGGLFGLGLVWAFHNGTLTTMDFQFALLATLGAEIAAVALVAANTAATAISKEREDGTLDLLLTTPITASAYLSGKLRGLVVYLLPLLSVPFGTLAMACLYVALAQIGLFSREGGVMVGTTVGGVTVEVPAVLPEAALLAPLVVVPFMAFIVMIGLSWSLKSKSTLASVVWTVGVAGVISGATGICVWQATDGIPLLGPVLGGLSPASMLYAVIYPGEMVKSTMNQAGVETARVTVFIGGLVAAGVYAAVCYGIHSSMVRTFDMTVRKLAGNK